MLTLADVYEALTGKQLEAWQGYAIASFAVDSRQCKSNSLFIALKGEQTDGHQYIADAVQRGAHYVIAEQRAREQAGIEAVFVDLTDAGHPSELQPATATPQPIV